MRLHTLAAKVAVMLCIAGTVARAEPETIALLSLDADERLEIYGQPVAAEIARVLIAAKLDVVVVDAKMAVPTTARLVIDGSIAQRGSTVLLEIRVRNPVDGGTFDKLEQRASSVAAISKAANKLSERLLPVVRARLEALRKATPTDPIRKPLDPPPPGRTSADPVMLLGVGVPMNASLLMEPFRRALIDSATMTMRASHRQPTAVDASTLGKQLAAQTVSTARAGRGIVFEILDYTIEPSLIPLVRARVRVRIADPSQVVFDRVLSTDTVVGDRMIPAEVLAARVAREVMTILRPHIRKLEPQWR